MVKGFLDSLDCHLASKGREVTVTGETQGSRVLPPDEIEYTYQLIFG
jgi:hypothetical protein